MFVDSCCCCCCSHFHLFIFSWKIIALQYCVGFCHTSTWISRQYTYVPSLLNLPPTSHPCHLLGCHRAPVWLLWVIEQIPLAILHMVLYVSVLLVVVVLKNWVPSANPDLGRSVLKLFGKGSQAQPGPQEQLLHCCLQSHALHPKSCTKPVFSPVPALVNHFVNGVVTHSPLYLGLVQSSERKMKRDSLY